MHSRDTSIGAGLLVVSLLVLWHVSGYPPAPGQPYNAALFPGIAAVGLGLAAIVLMIQGVKQRHADRRASQAAAEQADAPDLQTLTQAKDVEVLETAKVPSRLLAILLTAGSIGFYVLAASFLGFIITGSILLAVLMWSYGVPRGRILPIAIIGTLVIHVAFYKLLKVPLPWGLLQSFAW